jgi:hypothetical protein
MTRIKIPKLLAELVRARARFRCEYCQSSEWLSGQRCQIDHIIPLARGGKTEPGNLCLACAACNSFKLDRLDAADPESDEVIALFNPRTQRWHDHFAWSNDGTHINGLTPCGRATVSALRLNRSLAVAARAAWVSIDRHPPKD